MRLQIWSAVIFCVFQQLLKGTIMLPGHFQGSIILVHCIYYDQDIHEFIGIMVPTISFNTVFINPRKDSVIMCKKPSPPGGLALYLSLKIQNSSANISDNNRKNLSLINLRFGPLSKILSILLKLPERS